MTAGARPSWSPALLGALATAFYLATVQRQLWGDGVTFFDRLRQGGDQLLYNHALFLPLAKLVERVVSLVVPIDAERAMKVLAALAGGVGVGLTAAAGEILLRHRGHAAAAAAGVALMIGQWFHSTTAELHSLHGACAALLWLCLLAVVHLRRVPGPGGCALLVIAVASTPGSHVSGIGVLLPLAIAWWHGGAARARLAGSVAAGLLVFGGVYAYVMFREGGFGGFTSVHVGKHTALLDDPKRIPRLLLACLAEFGLYSTPALVWLPAGLRTLWRTAPRTGWLAVGWLLAWPLLAWPVDDRAVGSYYVPTYPVQALLAVAGIRAVARTWWSALAGLILAAAPVAVSVWLDWSRLGLDLESGPLALTAVCAVALWAMARDRGSHAAAPAAAAVWSLPLLAACVTLPFVRLVAPKDDLRDRLAVVRSYVDRLEQRETAPLVVFLATTAPSHYHWEVFFPGARDESRAFNPLYATSEVLHPERIAPRLERFFERIDAAVGAGRTVLVIGSWAAGLAFRGRHPALDRFFDRLVTRFLLEVPPGAPPDVARLVRRDR